MDQATRLLLFSSALSLTACTRGPTLDEARRATSAVSSVISPAMTYFNDLSHTRIYSCPQGGTIEGQQGSFGSGHTQCLECQFRSCAAGGVTMDAVPGIFFDPTQPHEFYGKVKFSGALAFECVFDNLILTLPVSGTACGYDAHDVL